MRTDNRQRSVLLFGKSQKIVDDAVDDLRGLGYKAYGTNDFFSDVAKRYDLALIDLVVLGGQVPPDRKSQLRAEFAAANPDVIFVESLLGIPGVIVVQVRGAFHNVHHDDAEAPGFTPVDRAIRLTVASTSRVKVIAWWRTSYEGPDPESDSLVLLDEDLAAGDHTIPISDQIPRSFSFATVEVGSDQFYALSVATEQ
ncbi:MAG TPA: hypothetical protein VFE59_00070 [Trebonia sp.]|jgi:hypothetical protein|nr:hypothetical protein [Trebonia sp.]